MAVHELSVAMWMLMPCAGPAVMGVAVVPIVVAVLVIVFDCGMVMFVEVG